MWGYGDKGNKFWLFLLFRNDRTYWIVFDLFFYGHHQLVTRNLYAMSGKKLSIHFEGDFDEMSNTEQGRKKIPDGKRLQFTRFNFT